MYITFVRHWFGYKQGLHRPEMEEASRVRGGSWMVWSAFGEGNKYLVAWASPFGGRVILRVRICVGG